MAVTPSTLTDKLLDEVSQLEKAIDRYILTQDRAQTYVPNHTTYFINDYYNLCPFKVTANHMVILKERYLKAGWKYFKQYSSPYNETSLIISTNEELADTYGKM